MNDLTNRPSYLGQSKNINAMLGGGLSASQPPRISTKGDRFTLIDENGVKHPTIAPMIDINVVIVGANVNVSQLYWERFDPNDATPPDCFSDNGEGPSEHSLRPQHVTCAGCPQAQWTKINPETGSTTPWCKNYKKIAVIVAGAGDTVYLMMIPPASIKKTWQPYVNSLEEKGIAAQDVVTRITIEDKKWVFKSIDWIPQSAAEFIRGVVKGDMPDNVVNAFDKVKQNVPAVMRAVIERPANVEFPKKIEAPLTAAQAETVQTPKRGRPRARANETVIGPGPIAPETPFPKAEVPFGRPGWQETLNAIDPDREAVNGFGMQSAESPTPDMTARLDKMFGKFGG